MTSTDARVQWYRVSRAGDTAAEPVPSSVNAVFSSTASGPLSTASGSVFLTTTLTLTGGDFFPWSSSTTSSKP